MTIEERLIRIKAGIQSKWTVRVFWDDVARILDYSPATVLLWRRGKSIPSPKALRKIAEAEKLYCEEKE